jgi:TPR repeat protein
MAQAQSNNKVGEIDPQGGNAKTKGATMRMSAVIALVALTTQVAGCKRQSPEGATPTSASKSEQKPESGQQSEPHQKQFEEIKAKAAQGDAVAQNELGTRYLRGQGVAKDPAEAVKWFRKAADQSQPIAAVAQYNLGYCPRIALQKSLRIDCLWPVQLVGRDHL